MLVVQLLQQGNFISTSDKSLCMRDRSNKYVGWLCDNMDNKETTHDSDGSPVHACGLESVDALKSCEGETGDASSGGGGLLQLYVLLGSHLCDCRMTRW